MDVWPELNPIYFATLTTKTTSTVSSAFLQAGPNIPECGMVHRNDGLISRIRKV